jgi:RNA polymerase sigma-70 factor (ECF subfamily)
MSDDDRLLLEGLKNSDESAFEKLFKKYRKSLYEYVHAWSNRDYDLTSEIVQKTFIKVWLNRDSIKPELPFWPFIRTIAENFLRDKWKWQSMIRRIFAPAIDNDKPEDKSKIEQVSDSNQKTEDSILAEELLDRIIYIADRYLPPKCKTIFILSRFWNWKNSKIAESLEISVHTVENQLWKALRILRKKLKEDGIGL